MIFYHGLPITPDNAAVPAIGAGHAFVSFRYREQLALAMQLCQSFALDNGAFSAWKAGIPVRDWKEYYQWVSKCSRIPSFDFAVIPDTIEGTSQENDDLVAEWPHAKHLGAPVWHLHEAMGRLERLVAEWPRVCLGSSGDYADIGTDRWWHRMGQAMRVICDSDGRPKTKVHGLRMMAPAIAQSFPFASVDSTNIARNIGLDSRWTGSYSPPSKAARAAILRGRIESTPRCHVWQSRGDTAESAMLFEIH